jgi:nucleoside-diphosphate-sugar epimerase
VCVRPDAFPEIWLSPVVGLDWPNRKLTVYGRGDNPVRYVAVRDVAEATVSAMFADDPPPVLEFGGPEALTRNDIVERARERLGELRVRHVPRAALVVGSRVLAPVKQELADTQPPTWDDRPLRELGMDPRPASEYLDGALAGHD